MNTLLYVSGFKLDQFIIIYYIYLPQHYETLKKT